MEKIINVKVCGSEIEQSTGVGGIQGEGGARVLKISFDEEWSTYSKSVTFFDANMENPVKVILTTANRNSDGSYSVSIPSAPLKTGGKFTYIIDGSASGVLQRSVKKELKVRYAPVVSSASLPSAVTPSQADQLNLSIQNESARIDILETDSESAKGDIANLKGRMTVAESDIDNLELRASEHDSKLDNHAQNIVVIKENAIELRETVNKNKTESDSWHNELLNFYLPFVFESYTANVPQAIGGINDTSFLTPKTGKAQIDHILEDYYSKEEVDAQIGDIATALDNIIAIQNELIGGETA